MPPLPSLRTHLVHGAFSNTPQQLEPVSLPSFVQPSFTSPRSTLAMSQQSRNFSQDMPPPGGFGNVKIDYRPQKKGFSNITFLAITTAVITFGLGRYIYYQKKEKSAGCGG